MALIKICFFALAFGFTSGFVNLALNKPTWQSDQYVKGRDTFHSSNAVDGLRSDLRAWGGQCVISEPHQRTATWWVNLESIYSVHDIRIYYRTDNGIWDSSNGYTARFLGFYVYVSNTTNRQDGYLCFHDTYYTRSTIPAVANIRCPIHGQYIIYYNERLSGVSYPNGYSRDAHNELCEVEVNGCKTGTYGSGCNIQCPDNCRNCHIESGVCSWCKTGYQGYQCENKCDGGGYGQDCGVKCGMCLGYKQCHHINGSCLEGCDAGYEGTYCNKECSAGKFGNNCQRNCNENCNNHLECNRITGECNDGCKPGWKGTNCSMECDGGFYGKDCSLPCGHCLNSAQCHSLSGSCLNGCDAGYQGPLCNEICDHGWYGTDCRVQCGYCKGYKPCHHVTGSCSGVCEPGYSGDQCTDNVFTQILATQREMIDLMRECTSFKRRNGQFRENFTSPTDFI